MSAPDDDDATVSGPRAPEVAPEVDDEATRVDPPKKKPAEDVDDEATQARPPPKQAIAVYKEKLALEKMGPPPKKKLHPLIVLGVALAILAAVLLIINALRAPPGEAPAGDEEPGLMHRLFNW